MPNDEPGRLVVAVTLFDIGGPEAHEYVGKLQMLTEWASDYDEAIKMLVATIDALVDARSRAIAEGN